MQNSRVATFTVSELLTKNQEEGGGGIKITPPTQIADMHTFKNILHHQKLVAGNISNEITEIFCHILGLTHCRVNSLIHSFESK